MKTSGNLYKKIIGLALATAFLLLIPLVATQTSDGWNWDLFDFAIIGTLIFGTGLTYILVTRAREAENMVYRMAVGVALAAAFLLVWVNGAVGIIGSENEPANLMYFGVLAVGVIGTSIARFQPRGMERAMFAIVLSFVFVIVIALSMGMQDYPGSSVSEILGVNGFFIMLFVLSTLLFRHAAQERNGPDVEPTA